MDNGSPAMLICDLLFRLANNSEQMGTFLVNLHTIVWEL
jgi:hypothetical protein